MWTHLSLDPESVNVSNGDVQGVFGLSVDQSRALEFRMRVGFFTFLGGGGGVKLENLWEKKAQNQNW